MNNLHQKSKLISDKQIQEIEKALLASWIRETSDPEDQNNWSQENKALGQCAITSVLIYDIFGGRMIYDKANFHIWNEFPDGSEHDFSRTQFKDERVFSIYKYKTKEDVLGDERGRQTKIVERYKKLKSLFNSQYGHR